MIVKEKTSLEKLNFGTMAKMEIQNKEIKILSSQGKQNKTKTLP